MESTVNEKKLWEVAEIQLSYKSNVKPSLRPKVVTSKDAYDILLEQWDASRIEFVEQFKVMLFNRAQRVLGIFEVSTGTTTAALADPRLIFAAAIKANAVSILMAHNHPSGDLQPSQPDIALTRKIREGGKLLEVQVVDHIILTTEGYYSFADEGLL